MNLVGADRRAARTPPLLSLLGVWESWRLHSKTPELPAAEATFVGVLNAESRRNAEVPWDASRHAAGRADPVSQRALSYRPNTQRSMQSQVVASAWRAVRASATTAWRRRRISDRLQRRKGWSCPVSRHRSAPWKRSRTSRRVCAPPPGRQECRRRRLTTWNIQRLFRA